jgi:ribonuclease PH
MNTAIRNSGRQPDQGRALRVSYDLFGYAPGSVLFEMGNTKVLCAASLQPGVPPFLRGQQQGWLTAEYAMLPTATVERTAREISLMRKNGRATEIARLISRALRVISDVSMLGERTIMVDCDVLQADGGTRTACINGAYLALEAAQAHWLETKQITVPFLIDSVAAIAVGIMNDQLILDPDYAEDSVMQADFNFVLTRSQQIIEMQGGAEKKVVNWDQFNNLALLAQRGIQDIFNFFDTHEHPTDHNTTQQREIKKSAGPLFSLMNREQHTR